MNRLQLALDVDDLDASIAFYRTLLGAEPAKVRDGYANFAVDEPALKLVLIHNPGRGGSINHLGIEVDHTAGVDAVRARLVPAGHVVREEGEVECCYARQDKFWVEGAPDGEQWEVYTVLEDSAVAGDLRGDELPGACC